MSKHNCWNCGYIILGGLCFPGACAWFVDVKKDAIAKQIPADIIDVGCVHWKEKEIELPEEEI